MSELSGVALREPEQMDWDKAHSSSKYTAPPPATGADGKPVTYFAQLPSNLGDPTRESTNQNGFLQFQVGPLKLVKNGNGVDGFEIKSYKVSVEKFKSRKTGEPIDLSSVSKLLKAASIPHKPQTNADYRKAIAACSGRVIPITLDWRAYKDGETVNGYELFPIDPKTGQRQPILRAGDLLTNGTPVTSEVLFANAQVKNVQDPNRK